VLIADPRPRTRVAFLSSAVLFAAKLLLLQMKMRNNRNIK
jgi:hypothetical protein